jgi:hypothetical protein
MKRIWLPQIIASLMLLWALNPRNPYGYYILLRFVCCGVFAFLTLQALAHKMHGWTWVFGITALLYNPFFRVHLTREIWSLVNVVTIVIAAASIVRLPHQNGSKLKEEEQ